MGRKRTRTDEDIRLDGLVRSKAWKDRNREPLNERRRAQYAGNKQHYVDKSIRWYNDNKEVALSKAEKQRLARYGLTKDTYNELLAQQGGRCAVCREAPGEGDRNLCIDHDYTTIHVRGLLCIRCNIGIGQLRDSKELLNAAIEYLGRTQTQYKLPKPVDFNKYRKQKGTK